MPVNELDNLGDIQALVYEMIEDDTSSTFWTPGLIDNFIYREHQALVSKVIEKYENFFAIRSTTDIVAFQEFYGLPTGARKLILVEHALSQSSQTWRNIDPLTTGLDQRQKFYSEKGRGTRGIDLRDRSVTTTMYHLWGGGFMLVPFFNTDVAQGLRIWWIRTPQKPSEWVALGNPEETWVPFDGLLPGHHEILAVGAAIRCKKVEEVPDSWGDLYRVLWDLMGMECENRQVQMSKQTPSREGYYP